MEVNAQVGRGRQAELDIMAEAYINNKLFSVNTLAEFLAVPANTINRWMQQGRLPQFDVKLGKRLKRWKYETIMERIQSGQVLD